MELFKIKKTINFMAYRKVTGTVSIMLILASILLLASRSLNFGIDFTGGTLVELTYAQYADTQLIRKTLEKAGYSKVQVKHYGSSKDVHIYVAPETGPTQQVKQQQDSTAAHFRDRGQKILEILKPTSPSSPIILKRSDYVGAQVGDELTEDGGLALLTALFCILLYVAFRFEYRFALGSVAALVHDVVIVLGIFSLFQIEFDLSVLAALLAVIGYSLNDTIVVFDRIRENFRKVRSGSSIDVMNISINETLSRTLMTSITTLLVLISLLILGGTVISGFATALIIGVVVGTYSSIFVASNIALKLGVSRADMMVVKKEGAHFDDGMP